MATYYGEGSVVAQGRKLTYMLTSQITHGAEGAVYNIEGKPNYVAKIYDQKRYDAVTNRREGRPDGREFMHAKLRSMVSLSAAVSSQKWASTTGHSFLAWPVDTLLDAQGRFSGYVMPRVKGTGNLYAAIDEGAHDGFFGPGSYTWKTSIKIAKQLAYVVGKLHECGIVVGDFNPQNFLLDKAGFISFVDIDSYTISPLYKTLVAFPGLVAPELQGKPWSSKRDSCQFTMESDNFSLACLVFQLLTGKHPFNAIVMRAGMASVSQSSTELNISNGDCPYVHHGIAQRQPDAPDVYGLLFPAYLRELCNRCFDYTGATASKPETMKRRPTAAEWYYALDRLDREQGMRRCAAHAEHYYLPGAGVSGATRCPWCERDAYLEQRKQAILHTVTTGKTSGGATGVVAGSGAGGMSVAAAVSQPAGHALATQASGVKAVLRSCLRSFGTIFKWAAGVAIGVPLLVLAVQHWQVTLLLLFLFLLA